VALEGLLSTMKPALSIEIGMAPGGSLGRIAAYSDEVHSVARAAPGSDLLALRQVQYRSTSWKITRPLREAVAVVRGGR